MQFKFCKQSQINKEELEKIVDLKKIHWNYTIKEHLNWIKLNVKDNDIHVLMFEKEELKSYLNLINIEVRIDYKTKLFFGIGNVCSKEKEKGYGSLLLKEVNNYLVKENKTGILLCKDSLVLFYLKNDWKLLDKPLVKADFNLLNTMVFNMRCELENQIFFIEKEF